MRLEATQFFDKAARDYLADEIEAGKQEVLQSRIIRDVKAAGGLWRQLFIATVTAILAPIIIGAMILSALNYEKVAPTISGMSGRSPPAENGQAQPGK